MHKKVKKFLSKTPIYLIYLEKFWIRTFCLIGKTSKVGKISIRILVALITIKNKSSITKNVGQLNRYLSMNQSSLNPDSNSDFGLNSDSDMVKYSY